MIPYTMLVWIERQDGENPTPDEIVDRALRDARAGTPLMLDATSFEGIQSASWSAIATGRGTPTFVVPVASATRSEPFEFEQEVSAEEIAALRTRGRMCYAARLAQQKLGQTVDVRSCIASGLPEPRYRSERSGDVWMLESVYGVPIGGTIPYTSLVDARKVAEKLLDQGGYPNGVRIRKAAVCDEPGTVETIVRDDRPARVTITGRRPVATEGAEVVGWMVVPYAAAPTAD